MTKLWRKGGVHNYFLRYKTSWKSEGKTLIKHFLFIPYVSVSETSFILSFEFFFFFFRKFFDISKSEISILFLIFFSFFCRAFFPLIFCPLLISCVSYQSTNQPLRPSRFRMAPILFDHFFASFFPSHVVFFARLSHRLINN